MVFPLEGKTTLISPNSFAARDGDRLQRSDELHCNRDPAQGPRGLAVRQTPVPGGIRLRRWSDRRPQRWPGPILCRGLGLVALHPPVRSVIRHPHRQAERGREVGGGTAAPLRNQGSSPAASVAPISTLAAAGAEEALAANVSAMKNL